MTYYSKVLEPATDVSFMRQFHAGQTTISCLFKWDTIAEEIYNDFLMSVEQRTRSYPLISRDGTIIRDYDYFAYWLTIPTDVTGINNFLDTAEALPAHITSWERYVQTDYIKNECGIANELQELNVLYKEQCGWCVRAEKEGEVLVTSIRSGGMAYFDDNTSVQFISAKSGDILYDDLSYVSIRIGVPDA